MPEYFHHLSCLTKSTIVQCLSAFSLTILLLISYFQHTFSSLL